MMNGEYSSVSLTGVQQPKDIKRQKADSGFSERPNALRSRAVDDYMKMIVGSGK